MFDLPIILAETFDPAAIGDKLGQAQNAQQVLAVCVTVLLVAIVAIVVWYLRERGAWNAEKVDLIKRWGEAKLAWEVERGKHAAQLISVAEAAADSREVLMREMLDLHLKIAKTLDNLANLKDSRRT